jgi:hypothetical protein
MDFSGNDIYLEEEGTIDVGCEFDGIPDVLPPSDEPPRRHVSYCLETEMIVTGGSGFFDDLDGEGERTAHGFFKSFFIIEKGLAYSTIWIFFDCPECEPEVEELSGGDWKASRTKPTFGIDHTTFIQIVDGGFSFNGISHDITDNFWTPFSEQPIKLGTLNTFTAKVYADKGLQIQEFIFGIPEVGKAQDAEVSVEVWYDTQRNIIDTIVNQKTDVVDVDSLTVKHSMNNCSSENNIQCDVTEISIKFLEPLFDKVMAVKAVDLKNRGQLTFLNEGFDISGVSLNPMITKMIPGPEKYEGLIEITQNEKYSNLWTAEDGRIFDKTVEGFILTNPTIQKGFNDSRNSEFQKLVAEGQALLGTQYFDSSKIQGSDKGFVAAMVDTDGDHREQTLQSLIGYNANW